MIRLVQRDETFRMACGQKNFRRIVYGDDIVYGRMHNKQCFAHTAYPFGQPVRFDVYQELSLDREGSPGEGDSGLSVGFDLSAFVLEQVRNVGWIARCADCRHCLDLGYVRGDREHGGATEAVADKQLRGCDLLAQSIGRAAQIRYIAGEICVGELPFTVAESSEIEAQHSHAVVGEGARDARGRGDVLGTGKTMGEKSDRRDGPFGPFEKARELLAGVVLKLEPFLSYF